MALIQPPLTFTGWGTCSHSQSFRFRKDLAALACKDEICRVQNQVPGAHYPLAPLFCRALPSIYLLPAFQQKVAKIFTRKAIVSHRGPTVMVL